MFFEITSKSINEIKRIKDEEFDFTMGINVNNFLLCFSSRNCKVGIIDLKELNMPEMQDLLLNDPIMVTKNKTQPTIIASISQNGIVEIFDISQLQTNPRISTFKAHEDGAKGICFTNITSGVYFCTYSSNEIAIYNFEN